MAFRFTRGTKPEQYPCGRRIWPRNRDHFRGAGLCRRRLWFGCPKRPGHEYGSRADRTGGVLLAWAVTAGEQLQVISTLRKAPNQGRPATGGPSFCRRGQTGRRHAHGRYHAAGHGQGLDHRDGRFGAASARKTGWLRLWHGPAVVSCNPWRCSRDPHATLIRPSWAITVG